MSITIRKSDIFLFILAVIEISSQSHHLLILISFIYKIRREHQEKKENQPSTY